MKVNPYTPRTIPAKSRSVNSLGFIRSSLFAAIVPAAITTALYLPFRLLASKINTITWGHSDHFYYASGTATWPVFAGVVAVCICGLAIRLRLRFVWHPLLMLIAAVTAFNTVALDDWFGWVDSGRQGFDWYPSNFDSVSTPELSSKLILPVFVLCWIATLIFCSRRKPKVGETG